MSIMKRRGLSHDPWGYGSLQTHPVRQLPTKPNPLGPILQERTQPSDDEIWEVEMFTFGD